MSALAGAVKNGEVVLDDPARLPDGARARVVPLTEANAEEVGPATPEEIAAQMALMDHLEPGWLSPEDVCAWREALQEQWEREKADLLPPKTGFSRYDEPGATALRNRPPQRLPGRRGSAGAASGRGCCNRT